MPSLSLQSLSTFTNNSKCTFLPINDSISILDSIPSFLIFYKVEVWCEASAYIQKDKSLKISINKTSSGSAAAPGAAASAAPSGDAWDQQF